MFNLFDSFSMKKFVVFLREVFSEDGVGSSKRIFGGIGFLSVIIAVFVLVFREGATSHVSSLIEFLIVVSTSLLGLTSVVSVFKKKDEKKSEKDLE